MQPSQLIKGAGDAAAHTTVIATLMGYLPAIAALFSVLWLSMQMYEKASGEPFHKTMQRVWERISALVRRLRGR